LDEKKVLILLFIVAFAVFSVFLVSKQSPDLLFSDEVFYYFQAVNISHGDFVWFDDTQPYFYPLFLSIFALVNFDVTLMRFSSAIFLSLASILLFVIVRRKFSFKESLLSFALFIFLGETIFYSSLLYTEALFIFLMLAGYFFYSRYIETEKKPDYYAFILILSLSFITRTAGFFLIIVYTAHLLMLKRHYDLRGFIVPFVFFVPYILLGGMNFIFEKTINAISVSDYFDFYRGVLIYSFFFAFLALISFSNSDSRTKLLKFSVLGYFLAMVLSSSILYHRYLFVAVPALVILISLFFFQLENKTGKFVFAAFIILNFAFACFYVYNYSFPADVNKYYFEESGCYNVESLYSSCEGKYISLPYFSQSSGSSCDYSFEINAESGYSEFVFGYPSNGIELYVDNKLVFDCSSGQIGPAFFPFNLAAGQHEINFTITNPNNIGGLGQLLLCNR